MYVRMVLNSFLTLLRAGISGMCRHAVLCGAGDWTPRRHACYYTNWATPPGPASLLSKTINNVGGCVVTCIKARGFRSQKLHNKLLCLWSHLANCLIFHTYLKYDLKHNSGTYCLTEHPQDCACLWDVFLWHAYRLLKYNPDVSFYTRTNSSHLKGNS